MHPYIPELKEKYRQGKISRREFMRMASLLGLSMSSMLPFLSSCSPEEEAAATVAPTKASEVAEATATPVPPAPTPDTGPKRGGVLRL